MSGPSPRTRLIVRTRAGGRCELCGVAAHEGPTSIHHRHPRRMGGTRRPWINLASNLLFICGTGTTGCHGRVESNRTAAYAAGWLLRDGEDPAEVPVQIHQLGAVYLTDEGDYATGAP